MQAVALIFEAKVNHHQRGTQSDVQNRKCLPSLEKVFKDIFYNTIRSTLKVKVKSMAQEFHAAFCDTDLDPHEADKVIRDLLNR